MNCRTIEIVKGSPSYAPLSPETNKLYISYDSLDLILVMDINKGVMESKIPANRPSSIYIEPVTKNVFVSAVCFQFYLKQCEHERAATF